MGNNKEMANISKATIGRLPAYHRYLTEKKAEGERTVSSTAIAEALHLSAVQVRKDLAAISRVRQRLRRRARRRGGIGQRAGRL